MFTDHVVRSVNEVFSGKFAVSNAPLFADHPYDDVWQ